MLLTAFDWAPLGRMPAYKFDCKPTLKWFVGRTKSNSPFARPAGASKAFNSTSLKTNCRPMLVPAIMPAWHAMTATMMLLTIAVLTTQTACVNSPFGSTFRMLPDAYSASTHTDNHIGGLNTFFLFAHDVKVQTSAADGGRKGTTRVNVKVELTANQLQPAMPVIFASLQSGLSHDVLDSFEFLKNYALSDTMVKAVTRHQPGAQPLFPQAYVAARASTLLTAAHGGSSSPSTYVTQFIAAAEAAGQRHLWTCTAPHNMLLLVPGKAVGAVADIMSVEYEEATAMPPTVTLTLDVVHQPHMSNELAEHDKQTLDERAHYHFFTPAGVDVDASKFLATLKAADHHLPALHMFAKGNVVSLQQLNTGDPCTSRVGFGSPQVQYTIKGFRFVECIGAIGCNGPSGNPPEMPTPGSPCSWADANCPVSCNVTVYSGCPTGTCNLNTATNTYSCDCPVCDPSKSCRPAVNDCDVAEVCTAGGACPDDVKQPDYSPCAWFPLTHPRYGPYSVDVSNIPAKQVSAEEAQARLSSAPAHLEEWPSCLGHCYSGQCVLKWDHPACCSVDGHTHYDVPAESQGAAGVAAAASNKGHHGYGHWEGPKWFCWD